VATRASDRIAWAVEVLDVGPENLILEVGRFHLFSQAPGWKRRSDADRCGAELAETLGAAGVSVEQDLVETLGNGFVNGVVARGSR
jgi:hypothetical protein